MKVLDDIKVKLNKTIEAVSEVSKNTEGAVSSRKRDELRAGLASDGRLIEPSYSPNYAPYKDSLSTYFAPSGTPDLHVTGKWSKSITAKEQTTFVYNYVLVSAPPYASKLMDVYDEPNNLTDKGKDAIIKTIIQPELTKKFKQIWN